MNVELGDAKQFAGMIKFGWEVFKNLKENGILSEVGTSLAQVASAANLLSAKRDVDRLAYYQKEGGLTREEAIYLLAVTKVSRQESIDRLYRARK